MMAQPLLLSSIIRHAARYSATQEIVSRLSDGGLRRQTYADCERRARMLASGLCRHGVGQGDRVGTLAWNTHRHLEIYYAVSGMGAICHTINPRLHIDQVAFIINDAGDGLVFFDASFVPLVTALQPRCPGVRQWVLMEDDAARLDGTGCVAAAYEPLLQSGDDTWAWPEFDENTAAGLCYTSGTTGNPKGVLYSHRSNVLHAYGAALPDSMDLSIQDVIAPLVPMFHVNAWGLPYSSVLVGAKLVLPGAQLDGESIYRLFQAEGVTFSAGVPSVWQGVLAYLGETGQRFSTFRRVIVGGSACSRALMRELHEAGVTVRHAWGMTEMSPLGTVCVPMPRHASLSDERQWDVLATQGRTIFGVDMRIVDDGDEELPWDGKTFGNLQVKGPWVLDSYFGADRPALRDGWFDTGDVAAIDADGYLMITDRSKDVIKSGGEWISSIQVENIAMSHPSVYLAACVAARHPKWDERPLLLVVLKPGASLRAEDLLAFFEGKVARYWVPDAVVFLDDMPLTATGKMQKRTLRDRYGDYFVSEAHAPEQKT